MTAPAPPSRDALRDRLRAALREDLHDAGDVTSAAVFTREHRTTARVVAKATGVLCGGTVFAALFAELDPSVVVQLPLAEGTAVDSGDIVAKLQGPTRSLLAGERTALNLLQRLSGIATLTRRFVEAAGPGIDVCDTRKTTPLWRDVEKYAVACGGGINHRMGLYDMVMLKDTHADGAGGLGEALRRVAPLRPRLKVAAEARNLDEVRAALDAGADLLMLDNMDDAALREAFALIDGRAVVEITGGVTLDTIARYRGLGNCRVSIGALTHSAPALDFSLRIEVAPGG